MADPVTLTLLAVSAGLSAAGAIQQGEAQASALNAQAQAAGIQADMQRQQAGAVASQTAMKEDLQRKQARDLIGKQLAAGAESGVLLNGSAADLFEQSMFAAESDSLAIRYEGELNRTGLLNNALMSDYEAGVKRTQAKSARQAGYLSAAATLAAAGYMGAKGGLAKAPGAGASTSTLNTTSPSSLFA